MRGVREPWSVLVALVPSLTTHGLAVVVGLLIYVLTTRVRRYRRPPTAAIAWVLGLMALPYLVLPAYLLFGTRKLAHHSVRTRAVAAWPSHWAERLLAGLGVAPAADARATLHQDGAAALAALRATIASATARLDIATFILADDAVGAEVMALVTARARAGVRVRLLIDGMGAFVISRRSLRALRAAGVDVRVFRPPLALGSSPRNLRNHRKLTIADGQRLWAGGRNLAAEYFDERSPDTSWHDLTFDLDGDAAVQASLQFEADWRAAGGAPHAAPPHAAPPYPAPPNCRAQFVPSGPDQPEDTVYALLIEACYRAERRLVAVTPYFVPDQNLETALRVASRRGVQVTLILPARSNHRLADFARSRSLRALADAGAEVLLVPFMVHAKAFVIDDAVGVAGSVNLDLRSLLLNYEFAVAFYSREQIDWLAAWMERLRPRAARFDAAPPGLIRDLAEGLVLAVGFQL